MPEVRRVVRSSYRDDYESDDDRSVMSRRGGGESYHTVQRYRVTPGRVEEVEDERRSSRFDVVLPRGDHLEIDRRTLIEAERPRSAVDFRPRTTIVDRYVEREREPFHEPERIRTTVYEERDRREPESARPWERSARPWEERDTRETDLRIEKRVERRDDPYERETDIRIEKRVERREDPYDRETDVRIEKRIERRDDSYDREIYQRETEYYDRPDPPPAPIVIRQRAQEPQQIIVQEAPAPPPIVLQPREEHYQIVRREEPPPPRRAEDEYYYRRDVREVGPVRRSDEEFAIAEYDRRDIRPRDSISDGGYSEEDVIVKKKIIRRERSDSGSPHHRRHLAEGALAGAGVAALLADHKKRQGEGPQHTGRNVVGGAALGAIGAEVITRARSRYREAHSASRSRSRSSSRHSHRKLKTALGLAAAGLAAAAAAKYVSNRKANREEEGRGRSRTRSVSRRRGSHHDYYSDDSYHERTRSVSKHTDPKHRKATIAKAGAATAVVAGIAEHIRSKSREHKGERSKSRLRTGAEIAGAGLAGAAVAGLYENRKAKEDLQRNVEEDEGSHRRSRRRSRSGNSRSRARSVGAHSEPPVDPELGMVQYGTEPVPVYAQQPTNSRGYDHDPAAAAAAAAAGATYGATRGHRSRSRRNREHGYSSSSDDQRQQTHSRSRSRSRARDIAGATAGTAAAAIGIHQYKKRKEKKEAERERERRRYEEEATPNPPENYYARNYHDNYSPSPPHASGGSYYPGATYPSHPTEPTGFATHDNQSTVHVNQPPIPPYNPADYATQPATTATEQGPYTGFPPTATATEHGAYTGFPSTDPPPRQTDENVSENGNLPRQAHAMSGSTTALYFSPPPTTPLPDKQLHHENSSPLWEAEEGRLISNPLQTPSTSSLSASNSPTHSKSVKFGPLSPTSSRSLAKLHQTSAAHSHDPLDPKPEPDINSPDHTDQVYNAPRRRRRRRRNSDPSSDRPNQPSKHRRRYNNPSRSPSPEVEMLPDRFDEEGRPLDREGNEFSRTRGSVRGGGQQEMVEKLTRDFGDVVSGKKTWKDMLRGVVEDLGSATGSMGGSSESAERDGSSSERRRRRHRRDADRA